MSEAMHEKLKNCPIFINLLENHSAFIPVLTRRVLNHISKYLVISKPSTEISLVVPILLSLSLPMCYVVKEKSS
jgi:hypothetical protein